MVPMSESEVTQMNFQLGRLPNLYSNIVMKIYCYRGLKFSFIRGKREGGAAPDILYGSFNVDNRRQVLTFLCNRIQSDC